MACKGICVRLKALKPVNQGRYALGQTRCQRCELFIKWDALFCPCCGYRLRSRKKIEETQPANITHQINPFINSHE